MLNLMDTYGGGMASVFIATIEITALMWGYGKFPANYRIQVTLSNAYTNVVAKCWRVDVFSTFISTIQ